MNALTAQAANTELEQIIAELEATFGPLNALMARPGPQRAARAEPGTPIEAGQPPVLNALMPTRSFASPGLGSALQGQDSPERQKFDRYESLPKVSEAPPRTLRQMLANWLIGDQAPTVAQERAVGRMLGTTGTPGDQGFGLADLLPATHALESGEALHDGRYGDAALSAGTAALTTPSLASPIVGGLASGARRASEAVRGTITGSPAAATVAGATAGAGLAPATAESPTVGPTKAEFGTPIPAPPTLPPSLDAYIERALKADRDATDARNEQSRRAADKSGRRFRPEMPSPKREAELRTRAEGDYGRLSDKYTEDMRTWESDRERIVADDRKRHFDKGFSERNPEAAGALMAASYIAPPLLTRGIWKGRYNQGQQILDDVYKAPPAPRNWLMPNSGASAASAMERGDVGRITDGVARAQAWSNPMNTASRVAMTAPVAALPAETRMGMDFWDRVMLPPDSAARERASDATNFGADPMGAVSNFLMQSIPGAIGAAGGFKMAGMSPGNDLRALQRYGLDASDPRSIASLRERVSSNVAAGRPSAGTGSGGIGPSGGPRASEAGPPPHRPIPDPGPPPSSGSSTSPYPPPPAPVGGGRPSSATTDNASLTRRPASPADKATADAPRWDKLIAAAEGGLPLADARAGLNANQISRLEAAIRAEPRMRPETVLKRLRSQGFPLAVAGAVAGGAATHHSHSQSRSEDGRFEPSRERSNWLMPE